MKKNDRLTLYYTDTKTRDQVINRLGNMVVNVKELPPKDDRRLIYIFVEKVRS